MYNEGTMHITLEYIGQFPSSKLSNSGANFLGRKFVDVLLTFFGDLPFGVPVFTLFLPDLTGDLYLGFDLDKAFASGV